jgi:hypothetical protein
VVPPTLAVTVQQGQVLVGATDPQSGIKAGSLSIKASVSVQGRPAGAELADLAQHDAASFVWTLPAVLAAGDTLTVSIRDNQRALSRRGKLWSEDGNITRIVQTVRSLAQPEAPPIAGDEQLQFLRGQIASLQSQVSALQNEQTANRSLIASLQGKLQRLKTAWVTLQTALEE